MKKITLTNVTLIFLFGKLYAQSDTTSLNLGKAYLDALTKQLHIIINF